MLTQAGPNLHHTQHAAFLAALRMVKAVARYTRVVYRHRNGRDPIGSDPEMMPAEPTKNDALAAARLLLAYADKDQTVATKKADLERLIKHLEK
jgi:hypothetical protein